MYSAGNQVMKVITKFQKWLNKRPSLKQWLWFILLWCLGLVAVILIAFPIKVLIKFLG